MKRPKLMRDWNGLRVKSLRRLSNGWAAMPPGTVYTVTHNHGGLHLRSDPCPECGLEFKITKVPLNDVVIVGICNLKES